MKWKDSQTEGKGLEGGGGAPLVLALSLLDECRFALTTREEGSPQGPRRSNTIYSPGIHGAETQSMLSKLMVLV